MPTAVIDTLLLLALPASGKSEVRRYLDAVPSAKRAADYHIGDTVQLDDFPYVHFLRMVDEALVGAGAPRVFYRGPNAGFCEPRDWGTLIHLVNDDHVVMADPRLPIPDPDPRAIFARIDFARQAVGAAAVFGDMPTALLDKLAARLEGEAARLVHEQFRARHSLAGKTLVIEFARGGPEGAAMPLPAPHGYRYAVAQLRPEILERAAILYIWVTPEESRRKNLARANPDDPGSVLHHSAPEEVMRNDYGCDDMQWLVDHAAVPWTIRIDAHGRSFDLPVARFDNRDDKTTFVRDDPATWNPAAVAALDAGIQGALGSLWAAWNRRFA